MMKKVNKLTSVDWTIKQNVKTNIIQCEIPLIELNLGIEQNDKMEKRSILLTVDKLLIIAEELKKMKKIMQKVTNEL